MKGVSFLIVALISSIPGLAFASFDSFSYRCQVLPQPRGGQDIGVITLQGDPVREIYESVSVNEEPQEFRYGTTSRAYLYLYEPGTHEKTFALEVVNFPESYESFEVSVYGPDHVVLGSRRIARYLCRKNG